MTPLDDQKRFVDRLVAQARALLLDAGDCESSPRGFVESELSLLVDQLDRARESHADAVQGLAAAECEVGTDLLRMETPRWWYGPNREERWRDRQRLLARRAALNLERTRLESSFQHWSATLEERVLTMVRRLKALGPTSVVEGPGSRSRWSERYADDDARGVAGDSA